MKIIKTKIKELSRHKHEVDDRTIVVVNRVRMTIADKEEEPETYVTFQVEVEIFEHQPYEMLLLKALLAVRKLVKEQSAPIESRLDDKNLLSDKPRF